jgi:CheY-like chemotaxis protein
MHPTVVVVDDEPPIVEVVCEALEEEDIIAVACEHGYEAYPCIRRHHPQVVILDVQMPGVDGIEVFQRLRADPVTSAIPVIFFTANAQKVLQRIPDYRSQGAELLPKPFDVDKLLDLVTRALAA